MLGARVLGVCWSFVFQALTLAHNYWRLTCAFADRRLSAGGRGDTPRSAPNLFGSIVLTRPTWSGHKEQAYLWLEKGYENRDSFITYLTVYPGLDPLRLDPRFGRITARVGIPAGQ